MNSVLLEFELLDIWILFEIMMKRETRTCIKCISLYWPELFRYGRVIPRFHSLNYVI